MLLTSPARVIIVDTKYTVSSTQTFWDRESLRSGHLYQLFTYLRNALATLGHAEGVLLYPADGDAREHNDSLQGTLREGHNCRPKSGMDTHTSIDTCNRRLMSVDSASAGVT